MIEVVEINIEDQYLKLKNMKTVTKSSIDWEDFFSKILCSKSSPMMSFTHEIDTS